MNTESCSPKAYLDKELNEVLTTCKAKIDDMAEMGTPEKKAAEIIERTVSANIEAIDKETTLETEEYPENVKTEIKQNRELKKEWTEQHASLTRRKMKTITQDKVFVSAKACLVLFIALAISMYIASVYTLYMLLLEGLLFPIFASVVMVGAPHASEIMLLSIKDHRKRRYLKWAFILISIATFAIIAFTIGQCREIIYENQNLSSDPFSLSENQTSTAPEYKKIVLRLFTFLLILEYFMSSLFLMSYAEKVEEKKEAENLDLDIAEAKDAIDELDKDYCDKILVLEQLKNFEDYKKARLDETREEISSYLTTRFDEAANEADATFNSLSNDDKRKLRSFIRGSKGGDRIERSAEFSPVTSSPLFQKDSDNGDGRGISDDIGDNIDISSIVSDSTKSSRS